MGNFFKKCLPPSKPYIEYIVPVSLVTTTAAPDYKYFLIPSSGIPCPPSFLVNGNCNCGSLFISKNFGLNIDGNIIKFAHNQDVLLNNSQAFIASTDKLNIANISDIDIDLFTNVVLKNKIQIIIKIKETNKPIAYSVIGNDSQSYTINTINLCLQEPVSLNNESLQVEFYSLCYSLENDCCDKLPSTITLIDTTTSLPCSTTTTTTSTTTLPPFCSRFNLPNLFYATVTAGYPFEGQEKVSLFVKSNNIYSTTGTFPCGQNYSLSMTCDPITEKFYYNGSIDCCDQNTKYIVDETSRPLIVPGVVLPPIVSYKNCNNCDPLCTTTTTTTTTSTTLPPIPCNDEYYGALTINGYAFYRHTRQEINIPGIGFLEIPCFGGHICDRTNFIPKLITQTTTISASPISLNNFPNGEEIDTSFSFNVPDITLLKNGSSIKLECQTQRCHQGVTWVVLTATINGSTVLLFNSCVLPNEIDELKYNCDDCCNWNGEGQQIEFSCNNQLYSIPFYKIGPNLFEANGQIGCGDTVNAIYRCNPAIKYNGPSSCSSKWEPVSISVPCAINPRFTGNILQPCECDKPPIYEWEADDLSNCDCCGGCPIGDGVSGIYIAGITGNTCWNIYDKNTHLFFSDCSTNGEITIKGIGLVGTGADNKENIENNVTYNNENIVIETDNKPKSAIIRTNSLNCISISAIGTRNTGSGQGWQHPADGNEIINPYNPCGAKGTSFVTGQGAYTITINDIDPSGQYEVHLRLGCSNSGPLFSNCPARYGTYFYVIGDNNGTGGSINNISILGCGNGPMIEQNILTNIEAKANWNTGTDCIVWLAEGWIIDRNNLCQTCRTKPEISVSVNGPGSGVILEPILIESQEVNLDDNGCSIPFWKLADIFVVNGGSGYFNNCQTLNFSFSNDTIEDISDELYGIVFTGSKEPINATFKIYGSGLILRNGGAALEPMWDLDEDQENSEFICGPSGVENLWSYRRKNYKVNNINIISGGTGYEVNDFIVINSINNDNDYVGILGSVNAKVSSVDVSGSILAISFGTSRGTYRGSSNGIIEKAELALASPGYINTIKPFGQLYKNKLNCTTEISGIYPTFIASIDTLGSGSSLTIKTARRMPEYFAISDIIINNGGSGYIDGQNVSFSTDIPTTAIVEAFGKIYVDSDEPKNPVIEFPYNIDSGYNINPVNGYGAILEPIFYFANDYLEYRYDYERPQDPCSYKASPRKKYKVSNINIIDGGYAYASGDRIIIDFTSHVSGINITGNFTYIYVNGVDLNGAITSINIEDNTYYYYGGSLTDSIGSIVLSDSNGCSEPAGHYEII